MQYEQQREILKQQEEQLRVQTLQIQWQQEELIRLQEQHRSKFIPDPATLVPRTSIKNPESFPPNSTARERRNIAAARVTVARGEIAQQKAALKASQAKPNTNKNNKNKTKANGKNKNTRVVVSEDDSEDDDVAAGLQLPPGVSITRVAGQPGMLTISNNPPPPTMMRPAMTMPPPHMTNVFGMPSGMPMMPGMSMYPDATSPMSSMNTGMYNHPGLGAMTSASRWNAGEQTIVIDGASKIQHANKTKQNNNQTNKLAKKKSQNQSNEDLSKVPKNDNQTNNKSKYNSKANNGQNINNNPSESMGKQRNIKKNPVVPSLDLPNMTHEEKIQAVLDGLLELEALSNRQRKDYNRILKEQEKEAELKAQQAKQTKKKSSQLTNVKVVSTTTTKTKTALTAAANTNTSKDKKKQQVPPRAPVEKKTPELSSDDSEEEDEEDRCDQEEADLMDKLYNLSIGKKVQGVGLSVAGMSISCNKEGRDASPSFEAGVASGGSGPGSVASTRKSAGSVFDPAESVASSTATARSQSNLKTGKQPKVKTKQITSAVIRRLTMEEARRNDSEKSKKISKETKKQLQHSTDGKKKNKNTKKSTEETVEISATETKQTPKILGVANKTPLVNKPSTSQLKIDNSSSSNGATKAKKELPPKTKMQSKSTHLDAPVQKSLLSDPNQKKQQPTVSSEPGKSLTSQKQQKPIQPPQKLAPIPPKATHAAQPPHSQQIPKQTTASVKQSQALKQVLPIQTKNAPLIKDDQPNSKQSYQTRMQSPQLQQNQLMLQQQLQQQQQLLLQRLPTSSQSTSGVTDLSKKPPPLQTVPSLLAQQMQQPPPPRVTPISSHLQLTDLHQPIVVQQQHLLQQQQLQQQVQQQMQQQVPHEHLQPQRTVTTQQQVTTSVSHSGTDTTSLGSYNPLVGSGSAFSNSLSFLPFSSHSNGPFGFSSSGFGGNDAFSSTNNAFGSIGSTASFNNSSPNYMAAGNAFQATSNTSYPMNNGSYHVQNGFNNGVSGAFNGATAPVGFSGGESHDARYAQYLAANANTIASYNYNTSGLGGNGSLGVIGGPVTSTFNQNTGSDNSYMSSMMEESNRSYRPNPNAGVIGKKIKKGRKGFEDLNPLESAFTHKTGNEGELDYYMYNRNDVKTLP